MRWTVDFIGRALWYIVLPLALSFFIVALGYWVYAQGQLSLPTKIKVDSINYQLFKDVLEMMFIIVGIGIAVVGAGLYKLLAADIETTVARSIDGRFVRAMSSHRADLGLMYWHMYEGIKGKNTQLEKVYLDRALWHTQKAHNDLVELPKNLQNLQAQAIETLFITIKNNWAYYLSEKVVCGTATNADTHRALRLVDDLEKKIYEYPERLEDYLDTVTTVRARIHPQP